MKLSYYNIFSDHINDVVDKVVFNTRTCEKILISKRAFDQLEKNDLQDFPEFIIEEFLSKGILISDTKDELNELISENINSTFDKEELYEVRTFFIHKVRI